MSLFWGKLRQEKETGKVLDRLALIDHCIDVAQVFRQLCELPAVRRSLNCAAGTTLTCEQFDRLGVFAFAHDLGKCNWGFQAKQDRRAPKTAGHIRETLPLFFDQNLAAEFCRVFDCQRLTRWIDGPESVFRLFLSAISHHGKPAYTYEDGDSLSCLEAVKFWKPAQNLNPIEGLRNLVETARRVFPKAFEDKIAPIRVTEPLEHRFAGLVMLADWLGSHREAFFPFKHEGDRIDWSRQQAKRALKAVGLDAGQYLKQITSEPLNFKNLFDFAPYPLQARLSEPDLSRLLIAESDTGSGKTEAALFHFLALFAAGKVDSLYFALPTRVAARELYERVLATMRRAFGEDCPPVLLAVPGYVRIDGEPFYALPSEERLYHEQGQRYERQWSAERPKRFLSATVAVGTIDQALLSAIRMGHAHLRKVCLDRALLVIDEVHSSDVYLRALSRRMLSEHLEVRGRALLLSATLGCAARQEYLHPDDLAGCPAYEEAANLPYPSLIGQDCAAQSLANPCCRKKRVKIEPIPDIENPEAMLPRIQQSVSNGQRVLVVLNTVKRAIDLTRRACSMPALRDAIFSCNGIPCPHHGRFAQTDRQVLDKEVSRRLGKNSPPGAVLLIGTQTLEQSLDIDADWIVTDLCPIDVLLQRIGRLHRHDRGCRPTPVCSVLLPQTSDLGIYLRKNGEVRFGSPAGMGTVYEDLRILQLTFDLVAGGPIFDLPRENRKLVEAATHPEKIASLQGPNWQKHGQYIEGRIQAMLMAADGAVIPRAHFGDFSFTSALDVQLTTRLGLDDRRLSLGGGHLGPFGMEIAEIDIPGHMARGLDQMEADSVQSAADGLIIRAGRYTYRYSPFGLEKVDEPAHG